jgi:hypothetical protein
MPKEQARESNVFELNAGERAKHVRRRLAERPNRPNAGLSALDQLMTITELSALDELMTILDGRRGH